jgi:rod shape-determining protein MreD
VVSDEVASRHAPVVVSMVVALMLTIAPMPEALEPFRPNWVVLTLIYWAISYPHSYSVGTAWLAGLVLDVAQGTLLGQNALALSVVSYVTLKFYLQLRQFPLLQLMATVFAILALYQFILFWVNGVAGINAPADVYWGPVVSGTLLWPVVSAALVGIRQQVRR